LLKIAKFSVIKETRRHSVALKCAHMRSHSCVQIVLDHCELNSHMVATDTIDRVVLLAPNSAQSLLDTRHGRGFIAAWSRCTDSYTTEYNSQQRPGLTIPPLHQKVVAFCFYLIQSFWHLNHNIWHFWSSKSFNEQLDTERACVVAPFCVRLCFSRPHL